MHDRGVYDQGGEGWIRGWGWWYLYPSLESDDPQQHHNRQLVLNRWRHIFCGEWQSGNYYLQAASPCTQPWCVDSCGVPHLGCYPVNCTTAAEEHSWGGIKGLLNGR